jgi:hypothetical protein
LLFYPVIKALAIFNNKFLLLKISKLGLTHGGSETVFLANPAVVVAVVITAAAAVAVAVGIGN